MHAIIPILATIFVLHQSCRGAPTENHVIECLNCPAGKFPTKRISNGETKKDIFISRGWGAGGMPFSVLYMNPSLASSKAPATIETKHYKIYQPAQIKPTHQETLPQLRTSIPNRQKNVNKAPHSVIPQLFVSYGWGPLGRK